MTATALMTLALLCNAAPIQQAKLTASDGSFGEFFGVSVAVSGDTAVVGAFADSDDGSRSGSAYIYVRTGTGWSQQAKLTASDASAGDAFGYAVAIEGDTVVVGARFDDDKGALAGSAYVFTRSGAAWTEQAKLTASDASADDHFGFSVAIDGDTVLVGAPIGSETVSDAGCAYIFTRTGTTWSQEAKLSAPDAESYDFFGFSVDLSAHTAIVGAKSDRDAGWASGSSYIFVRGGTTWSQQAKLAASDASSGDSFGASVAVDGDAAVIGAMGDSDDGSASGSAYVFRRSGTSWSQEAKLTATDAGAAHEFGISVGIDGDALVIGSHLDDTNGTQSGAAYAFTRSGPIWSQHAKLTASDAASSDRLGTSVALDDGTIVVGALQLAGSRPGAAYVFTGIGNTLPTADAGANVTIDSADQATTTISGTAGDTDGDPLTCRWLEGTTVLSGPTTLTTSGCTLDLGTLGTLSLGDHTLTLEISDGTETVTDTMVLTVANSAPTSAPAGAGCYELGAGNSVTLSGNVADFDGDTLTYEWRQQGSATPIVSGTISTNVGGAAVAPPNTTIGTTTLGLGTHTIELVVDDGTNDEVVAAIEVEVKDTTGPTLALDCSKTILWPPNHQMVAVTVDPNAADEGGAVTITASVVSNELINGTGDGDATPDWGGITLDATTGVVSLDLRAERSGSGNGRTYTVMITATDGSGNVSVATCEILVPKSKGKSG